VCLARSTSLILALSLLSLWGGRSIRLKVTTVKGKNMLGNDKHVRLYTVEAHGMKGGYNCTWQVSRTLAQFHKLRKTLISVHGNALEYRLHTLPGKSLLMNQKTILANLEAFLKGALHCAADESAFQHFYSFSPHAVKVSMRKPKVPAQ